MYEQSWRLVLLNIVLSAVVLAVLVLASYAPIALVLGVGVGPLVAALMHCAVFLVRDEELRLATAVEGLRLHWLRGLELGGLAGVVVARRARGGAQLRLVGRAHVAARVRRRLPACALPGASSSALAARRRRARAPLRRLLADAGTRARPAAGGVDRARRSRCC